MRQPIETIPGSANRRTPAGPYRRFAHGFRNERQALGNATTYNRPKTTSRQHGGEGRGEAGRRPGRAKLAEAYADWTGGRNGAGLKPGRGVFIERAKNQCATNLFRFFLPPTLDCLKATCISQVSAATPGARAHGFECAIKRDCGGGGGAGGGRGRVSPRAESRLVH